MSETLDLAQLDWPARRPESWKYTDLGRLIGRIQASDQSADSKPPSSLTLDAPRITWCAGELHTASPDAPQPQPCELKPQSDLAEMSPQLAALPGQAWLLHLDQSWHGRSLHLRFEHGIKPSRMALRLLLDEGVKVNLVEEHCGHERGLSAFALALELAPHSRLEHVRVQHAGEQLLLAEQSAAIAAGAQLQQIHLDWGASLSRLRSTLCLNGRESELGYFALAGLRERQHCDHQVLVRHDSPQARSVLRARGILDEVARAVFNGKIYVARGAQQTDSDQLLRNLLLSDRAEVDAKPELEIYADDVRCAHGSTVGRLDDTALFYLRSRGLDEAQARQLLMLSFAERILGEIKDQALHDFAREAIAEHLHLRGSA